MSELETVETFPWRPESYITGNFAIGLMRENILRQLKAERGVHAETLLVVIGAITGFSAQYAVWKSIEKTGKEVPRLANGGPVDFVFHITKSGKKFYFGDALNTFLLQQSPSSHLTLWSLVTGAAIQSGVPAPDLPAVKDMFAYVSKTIGSEQFGVPRVPPGHLSRLALQQALKMFWPLAVAIMRRPLPEACPSREPLLKEEHWPIVMSVVAGQFLKQSKDVLDPKVGLVLIMETAIAASKVDAPSLLKEQAGLQPERK